MCPVRHEISHITNGIWTPREVKARRVSGGNLKWLAGRECREIAAEPFARRARG